MKVMVTGSSGFIAKNLINKLLENNIYEKIYAVNRRGGWSIENINKKTERLVNIYADLRNPGWCGSLFRTVKPDIIFHLAAEQGRTTDAYESNVLMTSQLLQHCPEGCKFVYASSSTVYGDLGREDYKCRELDVTFPTSLYGSAKLAGEGLVHAYTSAQKINPLILRYVATVGLGASHGVLPDIINKIKRGGDLELFGEEPGSIKPYMYINDTVNATLHLVNNNFQGIYNISPADEISIYTIASYVDSVVNNGNPTHFKWLGFDVIPPGDNSYVTLDNTKLLETGWEPKYKHSMQAITQATKKVLEIHEN